MKKFIVSLVKYWPLLILGLIVRLVLMPITLHPDLWAISFAQKLFIFDGVTNIYDYLFNLPANSAMAVNYGRNFFTYPPLAYFSLGIFGLILKPFFNLDFLKNLASILPNILSDNRLYWHLFLTKLPYLFFDFGTLFLLVNLFEDEKKKKLSAVLWIFNPLSLYTSYMIGQFDIIPVFFTILSLYFAKHKKIYWAVFALGIGGAFKMFPLFFIPFLIFGQGNKLKESVKILVIGLSPYILSIMPFINSSAFRQTVLLSNQSQKIFFMKLPVSGAEYLSVFLMVYIFLVVFSAFRKIELWKWFLATMLLLFAVTHYHPQWFLWLSPFLLILIMENKKSILLVAGLLLTWLITTLLFEPSLSISLFVPIFKNLITVVPLSDIINRFYDVFFFKSLIRSVAAGISLWISILVLENEKTA